MLIGGIIARNSMDDIVGEMDDEWSLQIRVLALTVILLRAGIGLDISSLRSKGSALIRLTAMPQVFEAIGAGIVARFLFDISWTFALALGFMMAAVSPAVVVPSCINLRNAGYGVDKGIPSVVIAASSLDDVLAISLFGLFVGISFGGSGSDHAIFDDALLNALLVGPIEIIGGILGGIVIGLCLRPLWRIHNMWKTVLLFIVCYSMVLVSGFFGLTGMGFLASITVASTAGMKWGGETVENIEHYIGYLWMCLQVPLFGLVGASAYFGELEGELIWKAVLLILIGLCFRIPAAITAVSWTELTFKEKFFIGIAWMPKATVQAALGGVVLGRAKDIDDDDLEDVGMVFLTVAVFCILITAPIGAILTAIIGPRFLSKGEPPANQVSTSVFTNKVIPNLREISEVLADIDNKHQYLSVFGRFSQMPENEVQEAFQAVEMKKKGQNKVTPRTQSLPYNKKEDEELNHFVKSIHNNRVKDRIPEEEDKEDC